MTLYDFAHDVALPPLLKLWRFKKYGTHNVPPSGGLIVASNHASYIDPIALGVACPRPLSYMAKAELFRIPILGPLISAVNAYPVERNSVAATAAIRRSVELLRAGKAVGIFPQGTRVREGTGTVQEGVALLASLGKVPVVPAFILGSKDATKFAQIKVAFGPALSLPPGRKATREDLANFATTIMAAITSVGQELQSGHIQ